MTARECADAAPKRNPQPVHDEGMDLPGQRAVPDEPVLPAGPAEAWDATPAIDAIAMAAAATLRAMKRKATLPGACAKGRRMTVFLAR